MTASPPVHSRWLAVLAGLALTAASAFGQEPRTEPLRFDSLVTAGARNSLTDGAWGTLRVELSNTGPTGRLARVVVFYPERPEVQFSRELYVPARSSTSSWITVSPGSEQKHRLHRDMNVLLYDRTDGQDRLVLTSSGERARSRGVFFRHREPNTSILLDEVELPEGFDKTEAASDEAVTVARCVRDAAGLSENVTIIRERFLPAAPEAYDGIDVMVIASNRLANDPVGRQAIRRWVQQGGALWVLLDRVDPAVVAPIVGEDCDFTIVDRVRLETIRFHRPMESAAAGEARDVDDPVEMVRVALGPSNTTVHQVNDWPASFAQRVGRGQVIFTTLAPRGWYQARKRSDMRSRFEHFPDHAMPLNPLAEIALRLHPWRDRKQEPPPQSSFAALHDMAVQEIGYSIVGRGTVAGIFVGFFLAVLGLGFILRRWWRVELIGWLTPALALLVAGVFVGIGEISRRSVPPTIGVAALIEAVPGSEEAAVSGIVATYQPQSGPATLSAVRATEFELDERGLEGQTRQRLQIDLDSWRWEGLSLPAGVRTGTFKTTIRSARVAAMARFGPDGLVGRLEPGPFRGFGDSLVLTSTRQTLPARFAADNQFSARADGALPAGQYLTSGILTDQQQRRDAVYRELLGASLPKHWEDRAYLLSWVDPGEIPIHIHAGERVVGSGLLAVPLAFERPEPGTTVTVPRSFIPITRLVQGRPRPANLEGTAETTAELQFHLPPSVLPLAIERVHLSAKIRGPGWGITLSGMTDAGPVTILEANNPNDTFELDITDARLLRVQPEGDVRLTLKVRKLAPTPATAPPGPGNAPPQNRRPGGNGPPGKNGRPGIKDEKIELGEAPKLPDRPIDLPWKFESLGGDVVGKTGPAK